ncbi:hypothetical protein SLA2020_077400 [Shorea laevis]
MNQIDPKSGFNPQTRTFHSLRSPINLPPENAPLNAAAYALSLQSASPWPNPIALIDSATGRRVTYSEFANRTQSLASYLQRVVKLSKGDTAFVLCANSIRVPILYFSLLSIGVVISPANPISSDSEIFRQVGISKPVIAFATSSTAHKLPRLRYETIIIDSPEFDSMTSTIHEMDSVEVSQHDLAAIFYSSGTTGKTKGVMLTHRNLIGVVGGYHGVKEERKSPAVALYPVPYSHMFGFFYCLKSVAVSETVLVMERFDVRKMVKAVEEFRVTHLSVVPPVVVAMTKGDIVDGFDLRSLERVGSGAAPLGKEVVAVFKQRFPRIMLSQGYGLTESTGGVFGLLRPEECLNWGSAGRLFPHCEAKIVDPTTGDALLPSQQGEIWLRGPTIMKGYVDDPEATLSTLVSDGWLRTGDLGYIDKDGYLYVLDRLKELIKYKGFQVPPAELEQLLQSHPEITDAAVIPYPDEEAGELPMAFVVRQIGSSLSEAEIIDFVAKQVAPYKKIRRVAFVNSIPKTAAGKILRRELKKIALPVPRSSSKL